ncbi:MAG: hypothetical protein Q7S92_07140 [Candidatus Diapherotrites archaeon]|nr:hypothetical protein [Candidatus Diapherotrites archaeon]
MNFKFAILSSLIVFLILAGCTQPNAANSEERIRPAIVFEHFQTLIEKHAQGAGAAITVCEKENELIFVVTGSSGYDAESYYYNSQGTKVGEQILTQENPNAPAPLDLSSYDCRIDQKVDGILTAETQ